MIAFIKAFFLTLPSLIGLLKSLIEDIKDAYQNHLDSVLKEKIQKASEKAKTGDTSGYEDVFRGKGE